MCESAAHWGYSPSMLAAKWVIRRAGTGLLEQSVTDAMFQPVSGHAGGFGLVKDFDFDLDFISDG